MFQNSYLLKTNASRPLFLPIFNDLKFFLNIVSFHEDNLFSSRKHILLSNEILHSLLARNERNEHFWYIQLDILNFFILTSQT